MLGCSAQSTNRDSFDSVADYHEAYYKIVYGIGNGTAPGGGQADIESMNESDYGISDPDGTQKDVTLPPRIRFKTQARRTRTKRTI